jgi:hypothetical protein
MASTTNYVVSVTYNNNLVNGPVWMIEPSTLIVAQGDVSIYFTISPMSSNDVTIARFSWVANGEVVGGPETGSELFGPYVMRVDFTNDQTGTLPITLHYELTDDIDVLHILKLRAVHDPEIVLEPPHP